MEGDTGPRRRARHVIPNRRWILSILTTAAAGTALVIGVTAVRAATTSAPAAAGSTSPAAAPATASGGTIPVGVENALCELAAKSYRDSYGGMIVINNQTQMAIYLTNPTPKIEHAFESLAPAGMLVFRKTPHSLRQLGTIHTALRKQWDALIKQGIDLNRFGLNIQLGREDIGVVNLTPSQTARLDGMFGADMIHVYNITPQQAKSAQGVAARLG